MADWDHRFMQMAEFISTWSKDPSTKVGCVIVGDWNQILAQGYNGLPRRVNDSIAERLERPAKYLWTEHAERNALYNAARSGTSVEGASMYVKSTPALYPCADCARGIIQSGIHSVFTDPADFYHPQWGEQARVANEMMEEAGIHLYTIHPSEYELVR